jgi:hypothetical protein
MSDLVAGDQDEPKPSGDHPENSTICKPCADSRHDSCRAKRCECDCRKPERTPKHDWLDAKFDDEIDLERAMGEAPPKRLVYLASLRLTLGDGSMDRAWFSLGRFKTSPQRPSTNDARWSMACKRCPPGGRKFKTVRVVVEAAAAHDAKWLEEAGGSFHAKPTPVPERPERVYRVGMCPACRAIFWFEMTSK